LDDLECTKLEVIKVIVVIVQLYEQANLYKVEFYSLILYNMIDWIKLKDHIQKDCLVIYGKGQNKRS